ncbi:hypothetical protein ACEZCY_14190 [Streptacidiphilus sp. N1-12]|uniref:Uncharacterized protein n=2 Tax=Streptacidiphilus alkalitolerans TaxID=3342712 RepID=A0ABV6WEF9_9ACTN
MSVTVQVNAAILDLEIGQVIEDVELTPLVEGAVAHGYLTVLDTKPEAEPESEAEQALAAVEPEPQVDAPAAGAEPEPEEVADGSGSD